MGQTPHASLLERVGGRSSAEPAGSARLSLLSDGSESPPVYEVGTVVANVNAQSGPLGVACDSGNGELYFANNGANTVSVISGTRVVATISVMAYPFGVAYDSGNGNVYVTDEGSNAVSVVSGTSVTATVDVQTSPLGVAYDSENGEVYVANTNSNTVSVISGTTVMANVSVQSGPYGVAYNSGNGEVYVSNENSNTVSVISGTTVMANVSVESLPIGVGYDSGNGDVYVANDISSTVSVISGTTVVANVSVQTSPIGVTYSGGNGEVYVTNYNSNTISVISGTTVVTNIGVQSGPYWMAYDSGTGEVYVANFRSNTVSVVSTMLDLGELGGRTSLDSGQATTLEAPVIGPGAGITDIHAQVSPSAGLSCSSGIPSRLNASAFCQASSPGSYVVTLSAVDSLGNGVWTSTTVTVYADPSVVPPVPSLPSANVGQLVLFSTNASGGSGTFAYYSWGYPPGLGCAPYPSNVLTCVPTTSVRAGIVSVNVTDSNNFTSGTTSVTYTVSAVPALGTPTLTASATSVNAGSVVIFTASETGGVTPYSYVWTGLPHGCTNQSSAIVACSPASGGTLTVSVVVTDASGVRSPASNAVNVTVTPPTNSTSSPDLASTNRLLYAALGLAAVGLALSIAGLLLALQRKGEAPPPPTGSAGGMKDALNSGPKEREE